MSTVSLEARIRNAAAQNTTLVSLLKKTSPDNAPFRWCTQGWLIQGVAKPDKNSPWLPTVVTQLISNPSTYVAGGRLPTSWARVQFTIFGGQHTAGAQACEDVGAALKAFFATLHLSAVNPNVAQANYAINERSVNFFHTDTPVFQKIIDAMIWSDDTVLP